MNRQPNLKITGLMKKKIKYNHNTKILNNMETPKSDKKTTTVV
jgi:hypothetical protein